MQTSRTQTGSAGYFGHTHLCSGHLQHLRRPFRSSGPFRAAQGRGTCRLCRPLVSQASQQAGTAISDKQKLKDDITKAAGSLNGLDRQAPVSEVGKVAFDAYVQLPVHAQVYSD